MLAMGLSPSLGLAQERERNLAKELANPIAALYTLPLQMNFDKRLGADGDGKIYQLNIQPLIPFSLNDDWNLISRTIIPVIHQEDVAWKGQDESGFGDILQSFFLSPSHVADGSWIWGVGPAISLPTATKDAFGVDAWALGPTAVALKQKGPWTAGVLINHLWSLGDGSNDYNGTYAEPWVSYVLPTDTTVSLSTEIVYDWNVSEWSIPINFTVEQLVMLGEQPVSIGAAVKYWADSPDGGPEDWGLRLQCTFLFPR